jgi:hypothetical protein
MVKKQEITQHAKYTCTFCGKTTVKRKAVGIWSCRACKKTVAGGAYTVAYVHLLCGFYLRGPRCASLLTFCHVVTVHLRLLRHDQP